MAFCVLNFVRLLLTTGLVTSYSTHHAAAAAAVAVQDRVKSKK